MKSLLVAAVLMMSVSSFANSGNQECFQAITKLSNSVSASSPILGQAFNLLQVASQTKNKKLIDAAKKAADEAAAHISAVQMKGVSDAALACRI